MRNTEEALPRVVIVGGGFSGAALAVALAKLAPAALEIVIVEPRESLGRGVAYSTTEIRHFMNGPTKAFSLHPEDEGHFTRWVQAYLAQHATDVAEWGNGDDLFVPRQLYGAYVEAELHASLARTGGRVCMKHVRGSAVTIARTGNAHRVVLDDGGTIEADHVVLATGLERARLAGFAGPLASHPGYVDDPWDFSAVGRLRGKSVIGVIGSGLTMLDVIVSLERAGFKGDVIAISRHGLHTQQNRMVAGWPDVLDPSKLPTTCLSLLREVQHARKDILRAGSDTQALADAISPHLTTLWQGARERERRLYLRRLRAYWEHTRHGAAPATFALVSRWRAAGRLKTLAARVIGALAADGQFLLSVKQRGRSEVETISCEAVINCIGTNLDMGSSVGGSPAAGLVRDGIAARGHAGLGLLASSDCALIDPSGAVSSSLSAIGPLLRGTFWESNAIPEIVPQAYAIASRLAGNLTARTICNLASAPPAAMQ